MYEADDILFHMLKLWVLLLPLTLCAQTHPDLSGVWKADKDKSKLARPLGDNDYYVWIQQNGNTLTEKTMAWGPHQDNRMETKYDLSGAETTSGPPNAPAKAKATWEGNSLLIETTGAGRGGQTFTAKETWTLDPGGQTLTMTTAAGRGGQNTFVFEKQPESVAEVFSRPPRPASEIFKNLQVLGNMPGSQLFPTMRSFAAALGVECEHCHAQGGFDKDTNPKKQVARNMLKMVMAINKDNFGGQREVTCYTCHRGQVKPLTSAPDTNARSGASAQP